MTKTETALNIFCVNNPNSWHPLDEDRFKSFLARSYHDNQLYNSEELGNFLRNYHDRNNRIVFSEAQIIEWTEKYNDYLKVLDIYTNMLSE